MSLQSQTAVLEQRSFRRPQFNLLLWTMLALVAIGISAGIYALFAGHHTTMGVTREVYFHTSSASMERGTTSPCRSNR